MFKRKACGRCGKSLSSKYDFCPYCGNMLGKKEEDFGMLGKNDLDESLRNFRLPGGFNAIFNSLMRNFEKQMKNLDEKDKNLNPEKGNISISISTFGNMPPQIKMNSPAGNKVPEDKRKKVFFNRYLDEGNREKFSKLPRQEPKTNLRRVGNRIEYEVELPGVKSAKDISLLNLESSMELKAVSDKKSYSKLIPMNFPILNFSFSKGKLVLDLDAGGN